MIDLKFTEAMQPLAEAMFQALRKVPNAEDHITAFTYGSAAVVEALGIPAQMVASPTFRYVLAFAVAMEQRLALPENRAKGDRTGWMAARPGDLHRAVSYHAANLSDYVDDGQSAENGGAWDTDKVLQYAANVANFAMMVADRTGALKFPATSAALPSIQADESEAVTTPGAPE
jgi:hypothetical protein